VVFAVVASATVVECDALAVRGVRLELSGQSIDARRKPADVHLAESWMHSWRQPTLLGPDVPQTIRFP
jgi:hypothetical protein